MTKTELIKLLNELDCPDDTDVFYKFRPSVGTIGGIFHVYLDTYGFFGQNLLCILLDSEDQAPDCLPQSDERN